MTDVNYFEIIKNKLDALVDKIIQKENSDESFRITYAQILEKINTKMDVFSSKSVDEALENLNYEVKNLINEKNDVINVVFINHLILCFLFFKKRKFILILILIVLKCSCL